MNIVRYAYTVISEEPEDLEIAYPKIFTSKEIAKNIAKDDFLRFFWRLCPIANHVIDWDEHGNCQFSNAEKQKKRNHQGFTYSFSDAGWFIQVGAGHMRCGIVSKHLIELTKEEEQLMLPDAQERGIT